MKKKEIPFRGLCTALVTPFCTDGSVDLEAFRKLVRRQIGEGADALLVLGTTGESATLTDDERRMLVRETVRLSGGRIPVILYNIPSRTGVDLTVPLVKKLAQHPRIAGIKEASGSIDRAADLCAAFQGEDFAVYAGNDGEIVPVCSVGGAGAVSVIANLLPRETGEMCRAMQDSRLAEAAAIHTRLLPLMRALFAETNPGPVKAAMAMLGLSENVLRLPLVPVRSETETRLREALTSLGLL